MEQREVENVRLYKRMKFFLIFNIINYILILLGPGVLLMISNLVILFLFDICLLSYSYSSLMLEAEGYPKRVRNLLICWGLFVMVHLPGGIGFYLTSLYDIINFLLILFLSVIVYFAARFERQGRKSIAKVLFKICIGICFSIFAFAFYVYWKIFGSIFMGFLNF